MDNTYKPVLTDSIEAVADIDAQLFIGFDGDICGANEKAHGVSEVDTLTGEQVPVIVSGIALVLAGGTIAAGDPIVSDANGKGVKGTDVSVTIPADTTPVTSDGAQPTLVVAGGVLPQALNGYALNSASSGEAFRIRLV